MMRIPEAHDPSRRRFARLLMGGWAATLLPAAGGVRAAVGAAAVGEPAALDGLPRSRPEAQGVPPRAVLAFLDEVASLGLELHGFMLSRNGHVIAEGWWWPYRPDRPHMLHSATKSFTASGVAIAMAEGHFGLDPPLVVHGHADHLADRWRLLLLRAQAQGGEDALDRDLVADIRDGLQLPPALATDERVGVVHLADEPRPAR